MADDAPISPPPGPRPGGARRAIWLAVAALLVFGSGLVWIAARRDGGVDAGVGQQASGAGQGTIEPYVALAPGQSAELPPAPISARTSPAAVWTGREMVVWGGAELIDDAEHPVADGAAFDPASGQWRLIASSPLSARSSAAVVWTGTEVVVWGGSNAGQFLGDGAAYDPAKDSWRPIADGPLAPAMMPAVVWTGSEMVIVGGLNLDGQAAAYDPAADSWRRLDPAPARPGVFQPAVWTGRAMLFATEAGTVLAHPVTSGGWTVTFDGSSRSTTGGFAPTPPPGATPGSSPVMTTAPPATAVPGPGAAGGPPPTVPPSTGAPSAVTDPASGDGSPATAGPPSTIGPGEGGPGLPPASGDVGSLPPAVMALVAVPGADLSEPSDGDGAPAALVYSPQLPSVEVLDGGGASVGSLTGIPADQGPVEPEQLLWDGREVLFWSGGERGVAFDPATEVWRTFDAGGLNRRTDGALVWADGVLLAWGGFVYRDDGAAATADDGIILRPEAA